MIARTPVAPRPRVELARRWHGAPGALDELAAGDEVRVDGMPGARFRLLGFRVEAGKVVAELIGGKPPRGTKPGVRNLRTIHAERLRRP